MFMKVINVPHHIDCTYKLCERGFPLLVFGISDIMGQFFPISFRIISHEQEEDFSKFFETLLSLCVELNISPSIKLLMMDACGASFNAANSKLGPNIKILMCFFHVLKNVKEHLKGVDEKIKTEIVKDINYMHFCRNIFEFEVCKSKIYNKWITKFGLVDFKNYFENQWVLNSRFNKWVSGLFMI
jgi:hypothetical protein